MFDMKEFQEKVRKATEWSQRQRLPRRIEELKEDARQWLEEDFPVFHKQFHESLGNSNLSREIREQFANTRLNIAGHGIAGPPRIVWEHNPEISEKLIEAYFDELDAQVAQLDTEEKKTLAKGVVQKGREILEDYGIQVDGHG